MNSSKAQNHPSLSLGWRILYNSLLVIFIFHLIRDVMQALDLVNPLTEIAHRPHQWCAPLCDYITIPPEISIIIVSWLVLRRQRIGRLGIAVLISLVFWPFFILLP